MIHVVLLQPVIPQNTGNIIRLCANTGASLHLVEPLGFKLDHAKMRRAGLDYHEYASVQVHETFEVFEAQIKPHRCFAFSTHGKRRYDQEQFQSGDALLFGAETSGIAKTFLEKMPVNQILRLPMREHSRSLNLSNAVAVAVFEAWRQLGFESGF
jgi:tRNA (cytidine/uridine-2'-O-)-methyltransferase